jgi:hypothetical protein
MGAFKIIDINKNISFRVEWNTPIYPLDQTEQKATIKHNSKITSHDLTLIIQYTNGLGNTLHLTKDNIHQVENAKSVLILKNTFITINPRQTVSNNPKQVKRLSVYNCLDKANFELVLDWLLEHGLSDYINYEQNSFDVFKEYPNLSIFQQSLSQDCFNHYQSSLFSPKNWLVSNKTNNPLLPFYFEKKEYFNYFKTLNKEVVDYLVGNNRMMTQDNQVQALPLFMGLISYSSNQEMIESSSNIDLKDMLICHMYDVFLSLFLNTGKECAFDYGLFMKLFNKQNKLNTLFYLFIKDFIFTIQQDVSYAKHTQDKQLDLELIQYKKKVYQKILLACYDAHMAKPSLTQHNCITFFKNIESKKKSDIKTLLKQLLDYEEYLNHKVNISFIENNTTKNVNKKLIGLIFDKPFIFKGHIFTPLTHSYDFYMESEYMNNCVKDKEKRAYVYNYKEHDYNLSLFFHIVALNNLDNSVKLTLQLPEYAKHMKCTEQLNPLEILEKIDNKSDEKILILDKKLMDIHGLTINDNDSILTQINVHTKEHILYQNKIINGNFYELESKLRRNKMLNNKQNDLIDLFINQLNKMEDLDLILSNN